MVPQVPQYLMKKILILEKGDHGRGANFGTNILKFFSTIFVCLGRQERMWPNSKVYFTLSLKHFFVFLEFLILET